MIINVTQEHIDNGERLDCYTCPVALAVSEMFPVAASVSVQVMPKEVEIVAGRSVHTFSLPASVTDFINAFDTRGSGEPFSFDLPGLETMI